MQTMPSEEEEADSIDIRSHDFKKANSFDIGLFNHNRYLQNQLLDSSDVDIFDEINNKSDCF